MRLSLFNNGNGCQSETTTKTLEWLRMDGQKDSKWFNSERC